jgi:PhzF family phenazine biosynthesis protein
MPERITVVDAFTDRPFAGNPAAVCVLSRPRDDDWLQAVAREMNLSETAYLSPRDDGHQLRWFTPGVEVDLCGHATLASAHVLWESGAIAHDRPARFHTRSGLLTATKNDKWIELDFPATPPQAAAPPEGLTKALGVQPVYVGKSRFDYLLEVADEAALRQMKPDIAWLARLPVRGTIVTSRAANPPYDFVSRFFAPAAGVAEDPVTGSAHCCLAPYWGAKLGKNQFLAYQASIRGGVLRLSWQGERVVLAGQAVTIWKGNLVIPYFSVGVSR